MTKLKTMSVMPAAILILSLLQGCGGSSNENVLREFVDAVNKDKTSTGASADVKADTVILTLDLKDTPENKSKAVILRSDSVSQVVFLDRLTESMKEGEVLARIVKEKKVLRYVVNIGGPMITADYDHHQIREIAFKNQ